MGKGSALPEEAARRDPDCDGLVSIIHPWESGWDNSQRWDGLAGFGDDEERNKVIRDEMCARLKDVAFDSAVVLEAGWFDVEPVDFNCIYAENLAAMGWCARELGFDEAAEGFDVRAAHVREAVHDKMRDPGTGLYFDVARVGGEERHVRVETPAAFFPLFAGIPAPEEASALVDKLTSTRSL